MSESQLRKLFDDILSAATKKRASDVHLKAGLVPVIRKHGRLRPLSSKAPTLSNEQISEMLESLMTEDQRVHFKNSKHVDLAYKLSGFGHFRINAFTERGNARMVIRCIPGSIPLLEELNLPSVIEKIPAIERGLVLVTGATGSGKSTALASIVDHINRNRSAHIITVEDPIEYRIKDRKSIVSQVEVGTDATSFAEALRAALRQDPNVILVGEMRDQETIEMALTAAETGHLVLSTLHTSDTMETINRILSAFPPHQHAQLRNQLASVLKVAMGIRLAQRSDQEGFIPAVEIMLNNPRISELIVDPSRTSEITEVISESQQWQMQTFDQSLHDLLKQGNISMEEAMKQATNPANFALKESGISSESDKTNWDIKIEAQQDKAQWTAVKELELEAPTAIATPLETEEDEDDGNWLKKLAK